MDNNKDDNGINEDLDNNIINEDLNNNEDDNIINEDLNNNEDNNVIDENLDNNLDAPNENINNSNDSNENAENIPYESFEESSFSDNEPRENTPLSNEPLEILEVEETKKIGSKKIIIGGSILGVLALVFIIINIFNSPKNVLGKSLANTFKLIEKNYSNPNSEFAQKLNAILKVSNKSVIDFNGEVFVPEYMFGYDFNNLIINNDKSSKVIKFDFNKDTSSLISLIVGNDKGLLSLKEDGYSFIPDTFGKDLQGWFENNRGELEKYGYTENIFNEDLKLSYDELTSTLSPEALKSNSAKMKQAFTNLLKTATYEKSNIKHIIGGKEVSAKEIKAKFTKENLKTFYDDVKKINKDNYTSIPLEEAENGINFSDINSTFLIYDNKVVEAGFTSNNNPTFILSLGMESKSDKIEKMFFDVTNNGYTMNFTFNDNSKDKIKDYISVFSANGMTVAKLNIIYDPSLTANNLVLKVTDIFAGLYDLAFDINCNLTSDDNSATVLIDNIKMGEETENILIQYKAEKFNEKLSVPDSDKALKDVTATELLEKLY